jgi:hypothetical protein
MMHPLGVPDRSFIGLKADRRVKLYLETLTMIPLRNTTTAIPLLTLILATALFTGICSAEGTKLTSPRIRSIGVWYEAEWGGDCSPKDRAGQATSILTGSMISLQVIAAPTLDADRQLFFQIPVEAEWPKGLTLDAGFKPAPGYRPEPDYVPEPGLIERMNPNYYTTEEQKEAGSLWRAGDGRANWRSVAIRHFVLTIPEDLAGDTVYFRARWEIEELGEDSGVSFTPLILTAPCSRDDSARVLGSHIKTMWVAGDYRRAMNLADSMIQRGWSDPQGLRWAGVSAARAGDLKKRLEFLDYMYAATGYIEKPFSAARARDPEWLAEQRQHYEQLRAEILAMMNEQQR